MGDLAPFTREQLDGKTVITSRVSESGLDWMRSRGVAMVVDYSPWLDGRKSVMNLIEKAVAYAPPFIYSEISGLKSPTGDEVEGYLITVGGTPKEIMAHDPEFTYSRLLAAAELAKKLGAQIMGLGAFTKVVGDAGITAAKRASLPITTGNSYSASGALWAAHEVVKKIGGNYGVGAGRAIREFYPWP